MRELPSVQCDVDCDGRISGWTWITCGGTDDSQVAGRRLIARSAADNDRGALVGVAGLHQLTTSRRLRNDSIDDLVEMRTVPSSVEFREPFEDDAVVLDVLLELVRAGTDHILAEPLVRPLIIGRLVLLDGSRGDDERAVLGGHRGEKNLISGLQRELEGCGVNCHDVGVGILDEAPMTFVGPRPIL